MAALAEEERGSVPAPASTPAAPLRASRIERRPMEGRHRRKGEAGEWRQRRRAAEVDRKAAGKEAARQGEEGGAAGSTCVQHGGWSDMKKNWI